MNIHSNISYLYQTDYAKSCENRLEPTEINAPTFQKPKQPHPGTQLHLPLFTRASLSTTIPSQKRALAPSVALYRCQRGEGAYWRVATSQCKKQSGMFFLIILQSFVLPVNHF